VNANSAGRPRSAGRAERERASAVEQIERGRRGPCLSQAEPAAREHGQSARRSSRLHSLPQGHELDPAEEAAAPRWLRLARVRNSGHAARPPAHRDGPSTDPGSKDAASASRPSRCRHTSAALAPSRGPKSASRPGWLRSAAPAVTLTLSTYQGNKERRYSASCAVWELGCSVGSLPPSAICASFPIDAEGGRHLAVLGCLGRHVGAAPDQLRVRR
jgi:hypothetical protein